MANQIKFEREDPTHPPKTVAATAAALLALAPPLLVTISTALSFAENVSAGGILSLSSPLKKTRKLSHQKQIDQTNKWKLKEAQAQAHTHATLLVAVEGQERRTRQL
jgi:hypothetical protein